MVTVVVPVTVTVTVQVTVIKVLQMLFRMQMQEPFGSDKAQTFTETTAPDWLTSCKTIKGSTMDDRWFWNNHVLKLEVGNSIQTDFRTITRIA